MPDRVINRLRQVDPASTLAPVDPDERAEQDRALVARITACDPEVAPARGRRRRRMVVAAVAAATLAGSAAAVAAVITTTSEPPSEPTMIADSARALGIDPSQIGGMVLGGDAQLRVATAEGVWELGAYRTTFALKPPSRQGADGIECATPDANVPLVACLRGAGSEPFIAGRIDGAVGSLEAIEGAPETSRPVEMANGVYLLPDPSFPLHLRAFDHAGAPVAELAFTER